jgi:uncharacterized membrane protein YesL
MPKGKGHMPRVKVAHRIHLAIFSTLVYLTANTWMNVVTFYIDRYVHVDGHLASYVTHAIIVTAMLMLYYTVVLQKMGAKKKS